MGRPLFRLYADGDSVKSLAQYMSVYAAYHRNPTNRAIHFVMVPAIVWSLMVALDLVILGTAGGASITLAMPVVAGLLLWYLALDFALGIAGVVVFTVLLVSAINLNVVLASTQASLTIAALVFVASWIFQFIGHGVWEKRRPALADNALQVFVAPLFLISETAFGLGMRKPLEREVLEQMQAHLP
jgi:uncharacterized membrane protein YGL010W